MKPAKQTNAVVLLFLVLTSCDPAVTVDYFIVNQSDKDLKIRIFGLRDQYFNIIPQYDTIVGVNKRVNIHGVYWFGASDYTNPADTITVYDSIYVTRGATRAKRDFRQFEEWDFSQDHYRYGGGVFVYELNVRNSDF